MHLAAFCGFEGDRTDGALVEDFAVLLLNVALLTLDGLKDHVTVETSERGEGARMFFFHSFITPRPSSSSSAHSLVPGFARIVQTVLLDVLLQVGGATRRTALRTAERRLVRVDALVGSEAALVGQQHGAHITHLVRVGKKTEQSQNKSE